MFRPTLRMLRTRNVAYSFIGLNTVVFAAWKYADGTIPIEIKSRNASDNNVTIIDPYAASSQAVSSKQATMQKMVDNFILKPEDMDQGRWWTPLTCSISHLNLFHYGFNMFAFHSFAEFLWMSPTMTPLRFAGLCFGSGLAGSVGFLMHQKTMNNHSKAGALGASGIVMGAAAMCAFIAPFAKWELMFIPIGIPAWAMMGLYFAYDAIFLNDPNAKVGHSGHIGGALFGAAYYLLLFRRPALARNRKIR
ncbi:uncharacterized protein K452DRAFT_284731 [Aplosporella prunicola CBS 121167]|uniref:Peptidase S54 rhomboid domain-containing protein n=1 Tax=Aplosporella prunicola CBS 121167 TaxID=1176127 RepID=A0A6A6BK47_9PEZI|nr:uncharacterized protein K452DRAFT_284731 [Aplosporella prunicola CBS 121167]KAF2144416.1 hypothetical protein K452DRAFT_284731 [Aplosporella prunicola CBS 121167]